MDQPQPPVIEPPKKQDTSWHNSIASYMSRHILHVHAKSNEWYRVHRSSGSGGGGGNGWVFLVIASGVIFGCWLAYKVFMWTCELLQSVIQGICHCVIAAVPFILLGVIVLAIGTWLYKSNRS